LGEYNTSNVLGGVAAAAEQKGYSYSIKVLRGVQNEMEKVFDWFRCREIDGMIYYGFNMSQKHLAKLKEMRAMIVAIGTDPESGVPCVNLNSYSIFLKLTEYLIAKGYKKFVYLGGDGDVYLANMKYKGFLDTLKKYSIPFSPTKYINAGFGIDSAENIVLKMGRAVKEDTDAIICANDNMAVGTIRALLQMGLKVPLDIAVTGGDNIMLGRYIIPSLTTVHARAYQCGKAAFDLLYNIINNSGPRKNIKIESSLILRESA
jgi:DNA-binding LacI/PurR family transcriptional regulator